MNIVTVSGVQVVISGTRHGALGHDVRMEAFGSKDSLSRDSTLAPRSTRWRTNWR